MADRRQVLLTLAAATAGARAAVDDAAPRFEDAARLPAQTVLEADLCIVGAGAAGITLARELAGTGLTILLLEAGGERIEGRDQALCRAPQTGQHYFDLAACRLRYFGGTTNHWAGYSTAPPAADLEPRPDLDLPGWPVPRGEFMAFVELAARWLGHSDVVFDPLAAAQALGEPGDALLDGAAPELKSCLYRIGRRYHFGARHGAALAAQRGLRVVLHANVVHLRLDRTGRAVREAHVRSFDGPELRVRAARWVLAAHALENARLLLASNDVAAAGIGNAYDQVGRCFMEHPLLVSGLLMPSAGFPRVYDQQWASVRDVNWTVGLADATQQRHGTLQYQCRFLPVYAHDRVRLAARRLLNGWWEPATPGVLRGLVGVAAHPADAAALVARSLAGVRFEPLAYRLEQRIEQAPNPASRVLLDGGRDALGMPKLRLHWDLNAIDERSFAVGQDTLTRAAERLGLGHVEAPALTPQTMRRQVGGLNHHAGTARMSADPRDGVVDADCRVHGIDNLYVAGSAVFPRIGIANPTLLIVALSMRLAEHLKRSARG